MCISVQIRAVGGIYKYEPYIRLTKVKADNIIIETTEKNVKSIKGPNGEAIISYKILHLPADINIIIQKRMLW